jgi:hypothetical protein
MKINNLSIVALSLGLSVANGFNLFKRPTDTVAAWIRDRTQVEVMEGVNLPRDTENMPIGTPLTNFLQFSSKTNLDVAATVLKFGDLTKHMQALPDSGEKKDLSKHIPVEPKRSAFFRELFVMATNEVIKVDRNDPDPAEGYLYFGNRDFKTILPMLCQVNPFFASALTLSENENFFELKAFTSEPERVKEPLYLSFMREMVDDTHSINAKFDKKMNLVEITKLDIDSEEAVVVPEDQWDYYSSGIIYNLLFYSSTVHADIHVLHYLMCACIIMSTRDTSDSIEKWADIFDDNIAIKYVEVAALLFPSSISSDDSKLVSGVDGFGATNKIMPKVKKLLQLWGSLKNEEDFTKKFLLDGIYSTASDEAQAESMLKEGNILCEYKKHSDNVQPYADDLCAAFKEDNPSAFDETNERIKKFMEACGREKGEVSSIDSISSWAQLMCLTGIVHGSTLSYTRMVVVPEVLRWRNIHSEEWDNYDISLMTGGFNTAQGMTVDRHTFTSEIKNGFEWKTDVIAKPVMDVLQKYDGIADELKLEYTKEIEKRDDFREYGWILTDHCQDGYDGKQHTITTYI